MAISAWEDRSHRRDGIPLVKDHLPTDKRSRITATNVNWDRSPADLFSGLAMRTRRVTAGEQSPGNEANNDLSSTRNSSVW